MFYDQPYLSVIGHWCVLQMAVMVFKRIVFERRKAPKGILRPKTRTNLKDASQVCSICKCNFTGYNIIINFQLI